MEIRIPIRKLQEIMQRIDNFWHREKVTLREMQSLIGVLNFVCKAIVPGRPFCRRLINSICKFKILLLFLEDFPYSAQHNYTFVMVPNGRSSVTSLLNLFIYVPDYCCNH